MDRDYRGKEAGNEREIVENDKADVATCDALLVWFDRPSVGTAMEVLFAHQLGKMVVVVNASGNRLSPWLTYHSTRIFTDLVEAVDFINSGA